MRRLSRIGLPALFLTALTCAAPLALIPVAESRHASFWMSPTALGNLGKCVNIRLEAAVWDSRSNIMKFSSVLYVSTNFREDCLDMLHAVCKDHGLSVCAISGVNSGVGPVPCTHVSCDSIRNLTDLSAPPRSEPFLHLSPIFWNELESYLTSESEYPGFAVVQLVLGNAMGSAVVSSVPVPIHRGAIVLDGVGNFGKASSYSDKSPKGHQIEGETMVGYGSNLAKLAIEFPPENAVIFSSDVQISTIVEVPDAKKFADDNHNAKACFLLQKVLQVQNDATLGQAPSTAQRKSLSFCDDLSLSGLWFKGFTNGTYNITIWIEPERPGGENVTLLSEKTSRTFRIAKGISTDNWLKDPRIPLQRPVLHPTTSNYWQCWPCQNCSKDTDNRKHGEGSNLLTLNAAIPWAGEHQLLIPNLKNWNNAETHTVSPVTSQAWQQEKARGPVTLVVGIKVEASAFDYRQAIRDTWMRNSYTSLDGHEHVNDIRVWFMVGVPGSHLSEDIILKVLQEALQYGDMLLGPHPLYESASSFNHAYPWVVFNVSDSYYTLVEKTVTFMEFAIRTYPNFDFLMIVDNDVFLRMDTLADVLRAPDMRGRQRFFAGQVWQSQYGRPLRPQRDANLKNYLPWRLWPLRDLPPLAIGPHYLMSRDCVQFITSNKWHLRGVGTLEDVSISVWLRGYGVTPEHVLWFHNAKNSGCLEGLVSLSDLSPSAIYTLHKNTQNGEKLCEGLSADPSLTTKQNETSLYS